MDRFNLKVSTQKLEEWKLEYDAGHSRLLAGKVNAERALLIAGQVLASIGADAADTGQGMAAYMLEREAAAIDAIATMIAAHADGTGQTRAEMIAKLSSALAV